MREKRKTKLSLTARNKLLGLVFVSPLIIGLLFFFLGPVTQSIIFSFSDVQILDTGYQTSWVGLKNYQYLFFNDVNFLPYLGDTLSTNLLDTGLILIISFFISVLLNQKFKGRGVARAVFFLPVIITSGVLLNFEANTMSMLNKAATESEAANSGVFFSQNLYSILQSINLEDSLVDFVMAAIDNIYSIVSRSGVQILIFLSALQTISPSLKEAAHMDGATGWEYFWKVMLPIASPFLLVNLVYTLVDSFTDPTTLVMELYNDYSFIDVNFARGAAVSWVYFVCIIVIMGILGLIVSRGVYYEDK